MLCIYIYIQREREGEREREREREKCNYLLLWKLQIKLKNLVSFR